MAIKFEDTFEVEYSPLEYVFNLGSRGNHVLFDNDRIRDAFSKTDVELSALGAEMAREVREAINEVLSIPDFEDKKDFIESLPKEVQDVIIYLYFQMIEKTIMVNQNALH